MKALWGLSLGSFAVGTGALIVAGFLPDIARDTSVSQATTGQLIWVYAVVYAVCAPVLSALTGQIDRKRLLVLAAALVGLANILAALSGSFEVLLLARAIAAVGAAVFSPTAAAVASTLVPPERVGRAIALVFGGFVVSAVLGTPVGTWIGGQFGWPAAFWFVALLALLAVAVVAGTVPGGVRVAGTDFSTLGRVLRDHRLMIALSVGAWQMACQFVPYTFLALMLGTWAGADADDLTLVFLVFGVFSMLGNWLGGRITDRRGPTLTIVLGLIILPFVLIGLNAIDGDMVLPIILYAAWGMAGFSFAAAQQARLVQLAPDLRGVVLSLHASSLYMGQAAGAVFGAAILTGYGLEALGPVAALMALMTLVIFLYSRWQWGR